MNRNRAVARCPASCGELLQGMIKGREMLVSYPVELYSTASVRLKANGRGIIEHSKAKKALEQLFGRYSIDIAMENIEIDIETRIPVGKGMASSTADIAAVLLAAAAVLDIPVCEEELAQIAVATEPTDSIVYSKLTLFDHLKGEYSQTLGEVPDFRVLVVEGRELVDTVSFRSNPRYISLVASRDSAYIKLLDGLKHNDLNFIGEAATESSLLNQQLLHKPYLEELVQIAHKNGAAGVNTAHSGTVCGIICSGDVDMELLKYEVENKLGAHFTAYHSLKTVKGGPELI